ncbi:MAG TPA: hypothetical protein VGG23_09230, partial [Acidimicrobiales bacterium]
MGDQIADQATVTAGYSPTGTVTFDLYNNANADGTPLFTDTETLSGGTATSKDFTTTAAGTDYWVATYSGDSDNNSVSSGDTAEPVTVNQATPSLLLSVPSSGTAGTAIPASSISATLSGATSSASGTVTFTVYGPQSSPPTDCSTGGTTVGSTDVSGNGSYSPSSSFTPTQAGGGYYWYASYSGDANNSPANSGCGASMPETIPSGYFSSPGCSTFTVPDGDSLVDITATGSAGQTGSFGGDDGTTSGGSGDVVSGSVYGVAGQTLDVCVDEGGGGGTGGTSGADGGSGGGASGVSLGSDFSHPVLIAGGGGGGGGSSEYNNDTGGNAGNGNSGDSGGTAAGDGGGGGGGTQSGYGSGGSAGYGQPGGNGAGFTSTGPGKGGNGGAPTSAGGDTVGGGGGGGGGYYGGGGGGGGGYGGAGYLYGGGGGGGSDFCAASLSGGVSLSGCAPVGSNSSYGTASVQITPVAPIAPQITSGSSTTFTVGQAGSFKVQSTGRPSAALSESGSLPGGVSFTDNGDGTASLAGTPAAGEAGSYPITITASNGVSPDATQSFTLTVHAAPSISTQSQPSSVAVGGSIADQATVSGGDSPTGTVTFDLYDNASASGTPLFTDTETLSGGSATSASYTTTATGTDYWVATYNGDANNNPESSGNADDPVTVGLASPSISTTQQPASVTVGASVADQATVSGGYNPSGTVTFDLYDNADATGTPLFTDTEPLSGGSAISDSYSTTGAGTDYWVATYNGDTNNSPVSSGSGDEPVMVAQTAPSISTSDPGSGAAGTAISAASISATLSGASASASGTVTFTVFGPQSGAPTDCSSGGTTVGTAPVSGNGSYSPSSSYTPTAGGDYYWYATYSGDSNDGAANSGCGASMPETVVTTVTSLSLAAPSSGTAGTAISASSVAATLSNAAASASGTVTFTVFGPETGAPTDCSSGGTTVGTAPVSGGGSYSPFSSYTPAGAGDYYWYASYNGDANDSSASSGCGASMQETVVAPASPNQTFSSGCSTFTVPNGVSSIGIVATGSAGQGGGSGYGGPESGGSGDEVSGTLSGLAAGETLDVCVDQGGGSGQDDDAGRDGGSGGGASGVSLGDDFSQPVLIAGGGGGAGAAGTGGSAGLPDGSSDSANAYSGGGGTQSAVGAGGPAGGTYAPDGDPGSGSTSAGPGAGGGGGEGGNGGGGGGYYGGGGGGGGGNPAFDWAGGGGGSDFCAASLTDVSLTDCGAVASNSSYGTASVELSYTQVPTAPVITSD